MIEYAEALRRLVEAITPLPAESVPLTDCAGRYLAESVISPLDLPPFDNSAMDGYAIRSADTKTVPASLKLTGESRAGQPSQHVLTAGECLRISTGAMLPAGSDAVVMQEDVTISGNEVQVREPVQPWENIRFRGEDLRRGAVIAASGTPIGAAQIGLLAAAGWDRLTVRQRPRVAILSTGSELKLPGETLQPGQIYESNSYALAELIRHSGSVVVSHQMVPDLPTATEAAFQSAFASADVVLSIGGASVGDWDLVRPTVEKLGGKLDFWKLAIRPGKPFFFGSCENTLILGVPGNPVSAFVTTVILVLPALRALAGASDTAPLASSGVLAEPLDNPSGRLHFVRVIVDKNGSVRSSGTQASHINSSLAHANGLVAVPAQSGFPAGTLAQVIRW